MVVATQDESLSLGPQSVATIDVDNQDGIERVRTSIRRFAAVIESNFSELDTKLQEIQQEIRDLQQTAHMSFRSCLKAQNNLKLALETQATSATQVAALKDENASLERTLASLRSENQSLLSQAETKHNECKQYSDLLSVLWENIKCLEEQSHVLWGTIHVIEDYVQTSSEFCNVALSEQDAEQSRTQMEEQRHTEIMAGIQRSADRLHDLTRELGSSDGFWGAVVGGASHQPCLAEELARQAASPFSVSSIVNHSLLYLSAITFLYLIMGSYVVSLCDPLVSATHCCRTAWIVGEWPR